MAKPKLVPELDVSDLNASLAYYTSLCGFSISYERPNERFAYLQLEGAELMIQEARGPGRRFRTAPLQRPFGRGMSLQIEVASVDAVHERLITAGHNVIVAIEERWYETTEGAVGNRQFVVADPDGYLLRFYTGLGRR